MEIFYDFFNIFKLIFDFFKNDLLHSIDNLSNPANPGYGWLLTWILIKIYRYVNKLY